MMRGRLLFRRLHSAALVPLRSKMDPEETATFQALSSKWWASSGEFQALRTLNRLRVPLVRDGLLQAAPERTMTSRPLQGFRILDVGCGGGILAEPLARLGATVVGIDLVADSITAAEEHLSTQSDIAPRVSYRLSSAEDLLDMEGTAKFDAVIASELLEHVTAWDKLVATCADLLRPGGSLFITTLNKTHLSYWAGIFAAEEVFRIVPRGTHEWKKFIPLMDLQFVLDKNNFHVMLIHGMTMNPCSLRWQWISNTSVNYAVHAVKGDVMNSTEDSSENS